MARAEAQWVTFPQLDTGASVVLHFRREIELGKLPAAFSVRVSADNRFILWVNGKRAGDGPARGDLTHWRYERFDLRPYLIKGRNIIAAEVWSVVKDPDAPAAPMAQLSARTGFWLEGEGASSVLDTGAGWRVSKQDGHGFASPYLPLQKALQHIWYVAGAAETIDGAKTDWAWAGPVETGAGWTATVPILSKGEPSPWTLEADRLPHMTYTDLAVGKVVRTDVAAAHTFPHAAMTVPANATATLLIDQAAVVTAYPDLVVSGGKSATITVTYSEALYDEAAHKGDRSEIAGRKAVGPQDVFLADGGADRHFRPLWWRTWRYMQIEVKTGAEPLVLQDLKLHETGYPLKARGYFRSSDTELNDIWAIGWRTLKVDAHETFMDSAYWEQLQYAGDTRIEATVADGVSGDARLTRQAINAFGNSQGPDGMIQSAYPSSTSNIIPPFGLLWIGMMHDYWMRQPDTEVLVRNLPKARRVLDWYAPYVAANGLLTRNPEWNFVDWVGDPALERDVFPSFDKVSGTSCLTSLQYLGALRSAADLEQALGDPSRAADDRARADALVKAIRTSCWDAARGLYADDPSLTIFSQHTNTLAVLYDVAPKDQMRPILAKITSGHGIDAPAGMLEASYYFSWYLIQAHLHAGLGDDYLALLQTWRDLRQQHFTTWPEARGNTRSDTHAWTAHPTADLLGIVAGITPSAPGYGSVSVAPHPGGLKTFDAAAMTPHGLVRVRYSVSKGAQRFSVDIPRGLTGRFAWAGRLYDLKLGNNRFAFAGH